ncbi:hypothetical protein [Pedobacter miscanthi]|uniref:Uncharacterized protein n=1 Tax=Pedobacter miscanthi TaxID=2259170 RepID=A0A366L752_9SPHI|nr:hypothetical protein [Pedobacter miscanthi]RBQ09114.1 hypothetical protein DRW42_07910 [Pedobacter miscanthi]
MMEGENVKALAFLFNPAQPKAESSESGGIKQGKKPRFCRRQSFKEFIRHQIQALIFGYLFIKKKVRALRRRRAEAILSRWADKYYYVKVVSK